jgi:hypothetical protein
LAPDQQLQKLTNPARRGNSSSDSLRFSRRPNQPLRGSGAADEISRYEPLASFIKS